jgi:hypothetical protein
MAETSTVWKHRDENEWVYQVVDSLNSAEKTARLIELMLVTYSQAWMSLSAVTA